MSYYNGAYGLYRGNPCVLLCLILGFLLKKKGTMSLKYQNENSLDLYMLDIDILEK